MRALLPASGGQQSTARLRQTLAPRAHYFGAEPGEDTHRGAVREERHLRTDLHRTGDVREVLLRHRALELFHTGRGPGSHHPQSQTAKHEWPRSVPVSSIFKMEDYW